jgi:hypothetical protein
MFEPIFTTRRLASNLTGPFLFLLCLASGSSGHSAAAAAPPLVYEEPTVLNGTIYSRDPKAGEPLFKFKRVATRNGSTIRVVREYRYPDGKLAAREQVVYDGNTLASFELEELQTGASGSATVERDPQQLAKASMAFRYTQSASAAARSTVRSETLDRETLVNDMVGPFLVSRYERLIRGEKVGCRYAVVPRKETVGFSFVKASDSKWCGQEVLIVKLEPTSLLISALVDPLFFTLEKTPPHRVLQYVGRTTPKIGKNGRWKDLDAVTVFDW